MKKLLSDKIKSLRRIASLALAFVCFVTLAGVDFADIASADETIGPGKTYYYKWTRVRSDDELYSLLGSGSTDADNESGFNHRMLILYGDDMNNPDYRWTGMSTDGKNRTMYGEKIQSVDGIDFSKDQFESISNFKAPFAKYGGVNRFDYKLTTLRFVDSSNTYDSSVAVASNGGKNAKTKAGEFLESLITIANTKLFVYSCKVLYGGVQSASFYSKLVSTKWDDPDTSGAYKDTPARMFGHRFEWLSNGRCVITTERKGLLDATLEHDGREIEYNYYDQDEESQFIIYVSTLIEKPAIESDDTYKNYITNIINGLIIKPKVTLTVKDGATLKLSGEITNNGRIIIGNGGTVILDYGAKISTDPAAVVSNNSKGDPVYPGNIQIQSGGQLLILEGAECNIPFISGNTTAMTVAQGGTLYVAGRLNCAETLSINGGQFIVTNTGSYHQGEYDYGGAVIENGNQCLTIKANSLVEFQDSEKDDQYKFICSLQSPYNSDSFQYNKLGGIKYYINNNSFLYFYDGCTSATTGGAGPYGAVYNNTFTSGNSKFTITHRLSWCEYATDYFIGGAWKPITSGTLNQTDYVSPTGKVYAAAEKETCIYDACIWHIMMTESLAETSAISRYNGYKDEYDNAEAETKPKTTYAKMREMYEHLCNVYGNQINGTAGTVPESERGEVDLGCDGQEGGC